MKIVFFLIDTHFKCLSLFIFSAFLILGTSSKDSFSSDAFIYSVKKNENLSLIAKKFGTTTKSLIKKNNLDSSIIYPGQKLIIKRLFRNSRKFHRVNKGDSLSVIAKKYNTSIGKLKRINGLNSSKIKVGQKIFLKKNHKSKIYKKNRKFHKVKRGDSLSLISAKYKISVVRLKKINRLKSTRIKIGQIIYLSKPKKSNHPPSVGTQLGLRSTKSIINLNSSAVLVTDQLSGETMLEKNPDAVLPIASITKLMTALVIIEKNMDLSEKITISKADARLERYNKSRLSVGSRFSREDLLHLALMSSENRAAHALARSYPGGIRGFVEAMNAKAKLLGMWSTVFTEPTGLNSGNVSTPRDLIRLVDEASRLPLVRKYSTSEKHLVKIKNKLQRFRNSNPLVRGQIWDLGVSKTGFIRDAGRCLVMQAFINKTPVIIVMLDAQGNWKRHQDAEQIKNWILKANSKKMIKSVKKNHFEEKDFFLNYSQM